MKTNLSKNKTLIISFKTEITTQNFFSENNKIQVQHVFFKLFFFFLIL